MFVREINNRTELKLSTTETNTSAAHTYYLKPGAEQEEAATITEMLKMIQASCFARKFCFSGTTGLIVSLEVKHDFALNNCKVVRKSCEKEKLTLFDISVPIFLRPAHLYLPLHKSLAEHQSHYSSLW